MKQTETFPISALLSTNGLHYLLPLSIEVEKLPQPTNLAAFQIINGANLTILEHRKGNQVIPVFTIPLSYPERGLHGDTVKALLLEGISELEDISPKIEALGQMLQHEGHFCFRGSKTTENDEANTKLINIAKYGLDFPFHDIRRSDISMSIGHASLALGHGSPNPILEEIADTRSKYTIICIYDRTGIEYLYDDPTTTNYCIKITDGESLRDKLRAVVVIPWDNRQAI